MSHRVYILLDTTDGKSAEAVQSLCGRPGVVKADLLEGSPDILVICEAFSRRKLVKLAVGALAAVEQVTENVCLLPVRSKSANTGTQSSLTKENVEGRAKCLRESTSPSWLKKTLKIPSLWNLYGQ